MFFDPGKVVGEQVEIADDFISKLQGSILVVLAVLPNQFGGRYLVVVLIADIGRWVVLIWIVTHAFKLRAVYFVTPTTLLLESN